MSANASAIVVGVLQLFGSYAATNLVERAGRRFLFAISTIGTAFGLITLGVYMMLKSWKFEVDDYNWIPIASFSFGIDFVRFLIRGSNFVVIFACHLQTFSVIFIASWAILTLPFLVISEIMPMKLKEFGASFCMTLLWSFAFIIIKYLPLLTDVLQFHGTMFLFAAVCLSSALFIIVYMPETKGKSYDQIMHSLR